MTESAEKDARTWCPCGMSYAAAERMARHQRTCPDANTTRWGLTWVGGVLYYDTREEAERAHRVAGSGSVLPPGRDQ